MKAKLIFSLFLSALLFSGSLFSQKNPKGNPQPAQQTPACNYSKDDSYEMWKQVYKKSMEWNDLGTSTQALYAMIALHPEEKKLLDTLVLVYFKRSAFEQCLRVGKDVLKESPTDTAVLELVCVSEQALGLAKDALEDYEKLLKLTGRIEYLYEIATLQYSLKRLGECDLTSATIISSPQAENAAVTLTMQDNTAQRVPLKAAAINLRGVIGLELSKYEDARALFQEALRIYPEFQLAKGNLEFTEKKLAEGNKQDK